MMIKRLRSMASRLGAAEQREGDRGAALAHFHRAVELEPDSASAHRTLGGELSRQHQVAAGLGHLREAASRRPMGALPRTVVPPALPTQLDLDELFETSPGDGVPLGLLDDPAVLIDVWLDDKPCVRWQGRASSLTTAWKLPQARHVGLGASRSLVTFHAVRLQKVDGE